METISFISFKIAPKLHLARIASFFNIYKSLSWKEWIMLDEGHLELVFKSRVPDKAAYLFEFGCVTFVNFNNDEIRIFIKYLESIVGTIDYNLFGSYFASHSLKVTEERSCKICETSDQYIEYDDKIRNIVAVILAKSIALSKVELDLNELMERSEVFITDLQKGNLHLNSKKSIKKISQVVKFEYNSVHSIRIFDRPSHKSHLGSLDEAYDCLAEYFEFQDRFGIVQSKVSDLRNIVEIYSTMSFRQNEQSLYILEIILLALFPLSYAIRFFFQPNDIINAIKLAFKLF